MFVDVFVVGNEVVGVFVGKNIVERKKEKEGVEEGWLWRKRVVVGPLKPAVVAAMMQRTKRCARVCV